MFKKICNFFDKICNMKVLLKLLAILTVIFLAILCGIVSHKNMWGSLFEYNEKEYLTLENEADTIIRTKNFESEYNLIITHYDNNSNYLTMELSNDNTESITVTVKNLGKETQDIAKQRNRENVEETTFTNILFLFLFSMLFATIAILPIVLIGLILSAIELKITKNKVYKNSL